MLARLAGNRYSPVPHSATPDSLAVFQHRLGSAFAAAEVALPQAAAKLIRPDFLLLEQQAPLGSGVTATRAPSIHHGGASAASGSTEKSMPKLTVKVNVKVDVAACLRAIALIIWIIVT